MLFFIDESGSPHPNDSSKRPVIVAIGFPIARSRELARQIFNLKREVLRQTDPWLEEKCKAHAVFNRRTHRRVRAKWEYLEGVFELAVNFPVVTMAIVMEHPTVLPMSNPSVLPYHWSCLLQRINRYLVTEAGNPNGLLVMDSRDSKSDTVLSVQISNFLFRSETGRRLSNIVETPLFVDSRITPGIQIADYFASCLRQYHELKDRRQLQAGPYERAVLRLHNSVRRTVYDYTDADGKIWHGEYQLSVSKLERLPAESEQEAVDEAASEENQLCLGDMADTSAEEE